jgi:hypothetical protein
MCVFCFSEIDNNNFNFKIFKDGILLLELRLPVIGFGSTSSRRRAEPTDDESAISTTPSRNTRSVTRGRGGRYIATSTTSATSVSSSSFADAAAAIATTQAECVVCTNIREPSEQQFCQLCHKMLCLTCANTMQGESMNNIFNFPYCNTQFVADIIDLFID